MDFKDRYIYNSQVDFLGKGGFARVYKAKDVLLNRIVALKFFDVEQNQKNNLINEISKAIELEHENLCSYYDATILSTQNIHGETQVTEVGVLEYLDGGNLKDYLSLHPEYLDQFIVDILKGLSFLHKRGIIHRDLKALNILIKNTPEGPIAKITDFGLSKVLDEQTNSSSVLMGTIEYMAPEQFNPNLYGINGKISTNVDLWSLGVMLYELISGKKMFTGRGGGSNIASVMNDILNNNLINNKLFEIQQPYRILIERCLVRNANERAKDANELLKIFEEAKRNIHLETTQPSGFSETKKRNKESISVINTTHAAPPKPTYLYAIIAVLAIAVILLVVYLFTNPKESNSSITKEDLQVPIANVSIASKTTIYHPSAGFIYYGVDNPIEIGNTEFDIKNLTAKTDNGSVVMEKPGKFIIKPKFKSPCRVIFENKGKSSFAIVFKVKELPIPKVLLGNNTGGKISAGLFKALAGLTVVSDQSVVKNIDYKIVFFSFIANGGPITNLEFSPNSGASFNEDTRKLIAKLGPGSMVSIDEIKCLGPLGEIILLPSMSFNII